MDRRTLAVIAVVAAALTAGCAGFAADGGGDGTPTPTTDPTLTATAGPTPTATTDATGDDAYPAGWSEIGITNATVARDTHYRAVLRGPSATVTSRSGVIDTETDHGEHRFGDATRHRRLHATIDGSASQREAYAAGGTLS